MLKSGADQDPMVTPEKDIKKEVKAKIKEVEEEIKEVKAKIKEVEEEIKEVEAKIKEVEEDFKEVKAKIKNSSEEDLFENPLYNAYVSCLASLESRLTKYEARSERLEIQAEAAAATEGATAVAAPAGASASLHTRNPQYFSRFYVYVLYDLTRPCGMLTYGVRDFINSQLGGRPIGGLVYRERRDGFGQCVVICASGDGASHTALERNVLNLVDEHGESYWSWFVESASSLFCPTLPNLRFVIRQSGQGATKGLNSDPAGEYDNKSETKSQQSSRSSKRDPTGEHDNKSGTKSQQSSRSSKRDPTGEYDNKSGTKSQQSSRSSKRST